MKQSVVILSGDRLFAEMLALEMSMLRLHATILKDSKEIPDADVVIWDLDSAEPPHRSSYGSLIGFTKRSVLSNRHAGRECSIILRRPFELRLLRQEVLSLCRDSDFAGARDAFLTDPSPMKRRMRLDLEQEVLLYGEDVVPLSPNEAAVMSCLLERRGEVVSREEIAERIGESATNKIEVYICYLRRKMKTFAEKDRIVTVRGRGYTIP